MQENIKRIGRICKKHLDVCKVHGEFQVVCGTQKFKRTHIIRRKNLCIHGEDEKRLLAYSPNTPRETKLSISRLIMVQHENTYTVDPYFL